MRRFAAGILVVVTATLGTAVSDTAAGSTATSESARVAYVVGGDTIALSGGVRVRLLQINTPEPEHGECYSRAAGRELRRLLPAGAVVTLELDPGLDRVDPYGRLLRYVRRNGTNLNVDMVRRGAATVWFYDGDRGRYAPQLMAAATTARAARRGPWGACPRVVWDPYAPATTGAGGQRGAAAGSTQPRPVAGGRCDQSYPTVCIAPSPPDLDCGDIPHRRFRVVPSDPHGFDSEGDGLGCES